MNILRTALTLILIIATLQACQKEEAGKAGGKSKTQMVDELAARKLASRAANLELNGNEKEADILYTELAKKYPNTKIFAQLKEEMFVKGISIANPNLSKTSQSMFKVQNMVINYHERKGVYPNIGALKTPPDAWGSQLLLTVSEDERSTYEFIITSKGPDLRLKTDDDLYLLYEGNRVDDSKTKTDVAKKEPQVVKAGSVEMSKLRGMTQSARRPGGNTGSARKRPSTEAASTRKKGDKKSNKGTGQQEVVISLEDL